MKTLTLELPEILAEQIKIQGITEEDLSALVIKWIRCWLSEVLEDRITEKIAIASPEEMANLWAALEEIQGGDSSQFSLLRREDCIRSLMGTLEQF